MYVKIGGGNQIIEKEDCTVEGDNRTIYIEMEAICNFEHLDKHNILYMAFTLAIPVPTALDDLAYNLNSGFQTDLVLLDFKKAFDKVPHHRLCHIMVLEEPLLGGYRISLPIEHNNSS